MKRTTFLILILLFIFGCSHKNAVISDDISTLVVEERQGDHRSNEYVIVNEISDEASVKKMIDILQKASWQTNVEVQMPRNPDYKMNEDYHIWVSPDGNLLEIVYTTDSSYVQLSESQSMDLLEEMKEKAP